LRSLFVIVHRCFGLFIAAFLFVAGTTGALISWDHEFDEWLNPHLFEVASRGAHLDALELAGRVEADDPRRRVVFLPFFNEEGRAAAVGVTGRVEEASKRQYEIGHNQVFVDTVTGRIVGQRDWGKVALDREHLLPFLYKLHYSLHIPEIAGIDRWGIWLMGLVGIVWLVDCFVGFYLTLPRRRAANAPDQGPTDARSYWQRWWPAWRIKRQASSYRRNLDLHRAFGLWLWLLLAALAFTSISMNLQFEVVRPILQTLSPLTPSPFELRAPRSRHEPIEPKLGYREAVETAQRGAGARGWTEPPGYAFYAVGFGVYAIGFLPLDHDPHGSGGMGVKTLYVDGVDGRILGEQVPWRGTAADVFMQLQFPIHSGRIAGIPGRMLISAIGIAVALLSVTGVVIWAMKRARRRKSAPALLEPQPDRLAGSRIAARTENLQ
jgi:uncharacterized iron-regulated membrane protein